MIEKSTFQITLEQTKVIVKIRQWISGREAEYIEAPILKAATLSSGKDGEMNIGINAETAIHEQYHRKIEAYIVSVQDGDKIIEDRKAILEFIVNELPEKEYGDILQAIEKASVEAKKK